MQDRGQRHQGVQDVADLLTFSVFLNECDCQCCVHCDLGLGLLRLPASQWCAHAAAGLLCRLVSECLKTECARLLRGKPAQLRRQSAFVPSCDFRVYSSTSLCGCGCCGRAGYGGSIRCICGLSQLRDIQGCGSVVQHEKREMFCVGPLALGMCGGVLVCGVTTHGLGQTNLEGLCGRLPHRRMSSRGLLGPEELLVVHSRLHGCPVHGQGGVPSHQSDCTAHSRSLAGCDRQQ